MFGNKDFEEEEIEELPIDEKNDHLKVVNDANIMGKIQPNEKILFSEMLTKKNRFGFNQSRKLIITDCNLYNFKESNLKRTLDISKIKGITVSTAKNCQEFVIHGNEEEHDYLYTSKYKYTIIYLLEKAYQKLCGKELAFIATDSTSLKSKMTTKSEKTKNPKFSRMDDSDLNDINEFFKHLYYVNVNTEDILYIEPKTNEEGIQENNTKDYLPFLPSKEKKVEDEVGQGYEEDQNEGEKKEKDFYLEQEVDVPLKLAKYEDFEYYNCIGKGRCSSTYIAKNTKNGVYYAVKVIDKEKILLHNAIDTLKVEKKILTSMYSINKSIVTMINCFQTFDKIFFSYTFYKGGDLLSFMEKNGGNFQKNKDLLFFYICQLVQFLLITHENKIIYRNLKPENILLDNKGNIKVTDFSKSKIVQFDGDKGLSLIGAPEYMSPEIILGLGQTYETDWWNLGILIYQLLYGFTPFEDEYVDKIYEKILYTNPIFYKYYDVDENLKDLVLGLLQKDVKNRLNDSKIKDQMYFKEKKVDWSKVENYTIDCPLKPKIDEEKDFYLENFDREFTDELYKEDVNKSGEVLSYIKNAELNGVFKYFK